MPMGSNIDVELLVEEMAVTTVIIVVRFLQNILDRWPVKSNGAYKFFLVFKEQSSEGIESMVNVARLLMLSKNHRLTSKSKLFSNFRAKSASTILQSKIDFSQATETQPSLDGYPSNKKHKKAAELSCAMVRAIEHYVTYL